MAALVRRAHGPIFGVGLSRRRLLQRGGLVLTGLSFLGLSGVSRRRVGRGTAHASGDLSITSAAPSTGVVGTLQTSNGQVSFVSKITDGIWRVTVTGPAPTSEVYADLYESLTSGDSQLYGTIGGAPITPGEPVTEADWASISSGTIGQALQALRSEAEALFDENEYPLVAQEVGGLQVPAAVLDSAEDLQTSDPTAAGTYSSGCNECYGACARGCGWPCECRTSDRFYTCHCWCSNYCRCHDSCCRDCPGDTWCCTACLASAGCANETLNTYRCTFSCRTP